MGFDRKRFDGIVFAPFVGIARPGGNVRNKPGNRRVVWDLELFGGGQDKRECVEAIGTGQRVTRGDKKVAG